MELIAHDIIMAKLAGDMLHITTPVPIEEVINLLETSGYVQWHSRGEGHLLMYIKNDFMYMGRSYIDGELFMIDYGDLEWN